MMGVVAPYEGRILALQPFHLADTYFQPFDSVYSGVTADLTHEATLRPSPEGDWLARLIFTFQRERSQWNVRPELERYRKRWRQLRMKLLRLAAGAYLHVSYDLPRAMADDWPGSGTWAGGPSELRGYALFTDIKGTFDRNFDRAIRDRDVAGYLAWIARPVPRSVLRIFNLWLHNLRRGAWEHARILATQPNRPMREVVMAEAMAAALEDTIDFFPWSTSVLEPPDEIANSPGVVGWLAGLSLVADVLPTFLSALALLVSLGTLWRVRGLEALDENARFLAEFGYRLGDYMHVAVRSPEEFESYRYERRTSGGRTEDPIGA